MLNPIRRIFETFSKFNNISSSVLFKNDAEAKKLFDVNSHSIDDLEADLNGKTKEDIISKVRELFSNNNAQAHFEKYWDQYQLIDMLGQLHGTTKEADEELKTFVKAFKG